MLETKYLMLLNFYLRDAGGFQTHYEAIAVIEYQGTLSSTGESHGHYICDIKDKNTNLWFKTNDNCAPVKIKVSDVSTNGYAILYKRT